MCACECECEYMCACIYVCVKGERDINDGVCLFMFVRTFNFLTLSFVFFSFTAGSPTPPINSPPVTTVDSNNNNSSTKTSRHTRNSSTGHIPSPVPYASPISIIPPSTAKYMQRRRSFDGQSSLQMEGNINIRTTAKLKPTPTPLSSVSARVTSPIPSVRTQPNARGALTVPRINTTSVPFPRGGRQIGATDNHLIRRSGSIERRTLVVEGKHKKWP